MKKILLFTFFMVLALFGQAQGSKDEKILQDIETSLPLAIANHNNDLLNSLYDDQYHGVTPNGVVVDKAKWIEMLNTNNPYVIFNVEEMKVNIYVNTAIISGKLVGKSKAGTVIGQSRFLHVFLKRQDKWKIIEEQGTLIIQE